MYVFKIYTNIPGSQIFLLNGFERSLIGATPLELDIQQFSGSQIVISYNDKEKAIYLDPNVKEYYVDFSEVRSDINKYGIYLDGQLQFVNINQFEDLIRLGNKFDTVYVDNKMKMLSELPELKVINDRYHQPVNETFHKPSIVNRHVPSTQNSDTDYTWLYVLLGLLFMGGIVWFITASTKKTEIVETATAPDSSAAVFADSAAVVVDSAAFATEVSEIDTLAFVEPNNYEQQKNTLLTVGVSVFNNYSATKPNYDGGCGSYFSLSRPESENGNYIFTGMISSFFSNNEEGAFVEMVIDGKVEHFSYYESDKKGNYIFLRGTGMTLEINLYEVGFGEESIIYEGSAIITKDGRSTKFNIYGISGC